MNYLKLVFILSFFTSITFAQNKYITKNGNVVFEASMPSFEEVKAENNNTTAILNAETGEFASLVFVKAFRFKNALMEEHFNENYAETDSYPKSSFKGKIKEFSMSKLTTTPNKFSYSGELQFHGKTKKLDNLPISLSKNKDGDIILTGFLVVEVDDFDVEIPKIVSKKISENVKIKFDFNLKN